LGQSEIPRIYFLCEGLQAPPSAGFHVHLLSLARALAARVPVTAFCWGSEPGSPAWQAWAQSLGECPAPDDFIHLVGVDRGSRSALKRKLLYRNVALEVIEKTATPGSLLWIRDTSTALFTMRMGTSRRIRKDLLFLYDVSTLAEYEWPLRAKGWMPAVRIMVERWLRRRFDLVRTLGEGMRGVLIRGGVDQSKVIVVPVGAARPSRSWALRQRPSRLLYVGSAQPWQGLSLLIEAMRRVKRALDPPGRFAPGVLFPVGGRHPRPVRG